MRVESRRSRIMILFALVLSLILTACVVDGGGENGKKYGSLHKMKYVSVEELERAVNSNEEDIVILDVRQTKDFSEAHVKNAIGANLHKANKEGDIEDGKQQLESALESVDQDENTKYYLVCYSGVSYAQVATNIMIDELEISPDQIYTVKGGMKEITANSGEILE